MASQAAIRVEPTQQEQQQQQQQQQQEQQEQQQQQAASSRPLAPPPPLPPPQVSSATQDAASATSPHRTSSESTTTVNLLQLSACVLASAIEASEPIRRIAREASLSSWQHRHQDYNHQGAATLYDSSSSLSISTPEMGNSPDRSSSSAAPVGNRVAATTTIPLSAAATTAPIPAQKKEDGTPVTDADYAAQRVIVRAVRRVSKDVHIVGEESLRTTVGGGGNDSFVDDDKEVDAADDAGLYENDAELPPMDKFHWLYESALQEVMERRSQIMKQHLQQIPESEDEGGDLQEKHRLGQGGNAPLLADVDIESDRISVIVDPLDGTKNYAQGDMHCVTTLAAVVVDNEPCFGVICKPFGPLGMNLVPPIIEGGTTIATEAEPEQQQDTTSSSPMATKRTGCYVVYGGTLLRGAYVAGEGPVQRYHSDMNVTGTGLGEEEVRRRGQNQEEEEGVEADDGSRFRYPPPPHLQKAIISSSRSGGIVRQIIQALNAEGKLSAEPLHVSGAGQKALRLLVGMDGEAIWPFPRPGTSLWDVAAADALLRATGGALTDAGGKNIDYRRALGGGSAGNDDGIVAATTRDLHQACIDVLRDIDDQHQK